VLGRAWRGGAGRHAPDLRDACGDTGISLVELPRGLTVNECVGRVMATVESLGLIPIG
jgi:hypothetical protein